MSNLEEKEKLVLRLLFSDVAFDEKCMEILIPEPTIDRERTEYLLMLSILGMRYHWMYFPKWVQPRLQGIYRYFRANNLYGIPWLKEKLTLFEKQGIPVLLMKSIAMRARYAADSPRQMSDFDLAVPEEYFEKACKVLTDAGCVNTAMGAALHARTFNDEDHSIDLHRWIFKTHGENGSGLWEKTESVTFQQCNVLVMHPSDMIIHIMDNQARDTTMDLDRGRHMKWLFDVRSVIEQTEDFSWESVAKRAEELGTLSYLKLILPEFADVFPEKLSEEVLHKYFPKDDAYKKWLSKANQYRKESEEFNRAVEACGDNIFTPVMALRELRHLWTSWHCCYKPELRTAGEKMSFIHYVCFSLGTDSPVGLVRKYLPAIWRQG